MNERNLIKREDYKSKTVFRVRIGKDFLNEYFKVKEYGYYGEDFSITVEKTPDTFFKRLFKQDFESQCKKAMDGCKLALKMYQTQLKLKAEEEDKYKELPIQKRYIRVEE